MTEELSFNPTVSSHGYSDAKIFFLSGFPLAEDITTGLALSGASERSLNNHMNPHGMNVKKCYRGCLIREKLEYSGHNPRKQKLALTKVNREMYELLLRQEITELKPNVIVPLDDVALDAVFPHIRGMQKAKGRKYWVSCYRGSVLPLREDWQAGLEYPVKVIPTLHPQMLFIDWQAQSYVDVDYRRIIQFSQSFAAIQTHGVCEVVRKAEHLQTFLSNGFENNDGFLTYDIETWGGFITCISFCFNGIHAISVPLIGSDIPIGELTFIIKLVGKALAHPLAKCGQNVKYDWTVCDRHNFLTNNVVHDTMLKASLIYAEWPKGLDFLTSMYTEMPYYKDEGKEYNPKLHSRDRLYLYNARDSLATHLVNKNQEQDLKDQGVHDLYYKEIAPLILIYKNMDLTGVQVDDARRQELSFKYKNMYETNLKIIRTMVGNDKFNPNSPKQVGNLIYEELGFPKRTKIDEEGNKSYKTDKDTLDDLLINHGESNKSGKFGYNLIVRTIACRKIARVSDYIHTELHADNRWRASSNLAGTETGRSSSSKTIDEIYLSEEEAKRLKRYTTKLGRSLQTISKHGFTMDEEVFDSGEDAVIANDLRSMFVPTRGFIFIEGDGSQAEARVVAVLAEDWELLAAFDQKPNIHKKTAGFLFDMDPELIGKESPTLPKIGTSFYMIGKKVRHAGNYDMRANRLSMMTHMSVRESEKHLVNFHGRTPNIREVFHREVTNYVRNYRFLVTPFGRKRDFYSKFSDNFFKECFAQIPQSTISDLTKFTMPRIVNDMPGYMKDYRFLTEQHDGILSEVRKERKDEYLEIFKRNYERPIDFRNCSLSRDIDLSVPAELSMSETNWQELN